MIGGAEFPRLTTTNHRVTSPATPEYNCIAWAAGRTDRWWQPGAYWPVFVPSDDFGIGTLERAFAALGYVDCGTSDQLESGIEKVALYGSAQLYTHAARQLSSGKWTSKLGRDVDIEHDSPDDIAGGVYGEVEQVMRRIAVSP
jgi:hypothetical protein